MGFAVFRVSPADDILFLMSAAGMHSTGPWIRSVDPLPAFGDVEVDLLGVTEVVGSAVEHKVGTSNEGAHAESAEQHPWPNGFHPAAGPLPAQTAEEGEKEDQHGRPDDEHQQDRQQSTPTDGGDSPGQGG